METREEYYNEIKRLIEEAENKLSDEDFDGLRDDVIAEVE